MTKPGPGTFGKAFRDPFGRDVIPYATPEGDADVLLVVEPRRPGDPLPTVSVGQTQGGVSTELAVRELLIVRRSDGATCNVLMRWSVDPFYSEAAVEDLALGELARRVIRGLEREPRDKRRQFLPLLELEVAERLQNRRPTTIRQVADAVALSPVTVLKYVDHDWPAFVARVDQKRKRPRN